MPERLLIVEDDATIRITVGGFLERLGYRVERAEDAAGALERCRAERYDLVLLDLRLPDGNGLDLLPKLRDLDDTALVIVMTAYPEVRTAVAALKAGAYDYINKPFDLDDLRQLIERALETHRLRHELRWRRAQAEVCPIEGMIGRSPAFRQLVDVTHKIAAAGRVPVLIRGESGTGKERVARAIHCLSARAAGPWVAINCSALPEGLLESELFGHERGAFTDARQAKPGLFELADGGTLFLDEIGDLALPLQPKLLRALDTQRFRRVGGHKEQQVDVRFVAASNRDLPAMVKAGRFREDLYYRLNVGAIDLPPLRARSADVLPLAEHFLQNAAIDLGTAMPALDPRIPAMLEAYAWPGNVRELRNVIERAVILSGGAIVLPDHLPKELAGAGAASEAAAPAPEPRLPLALDDAMRAHIRRVLASVGGNKTVAAELLGITRQTLRAKLGTASDDD
jgi:DNA-binding NtrC family response regulator